MTLFLFAYAINQNVLTRNETGGTRKTLKGPYLICAYANPNVLTIPECLILLLPQEWMSNVYFPVVVKHTEQALLERHFPIYGSIGVPVYTTKQDCGDRFAWVLHHIAIAPGNANIFRTLISRFTPFRSATFDTCPAELQLRRIAIFRR